MPELPEVETVCRQLDQVLPGKKVATVEVLNQKSFQGGGADLVGREIVSVKRKQKMGIIELDGTKVWLFHLKMTGQLVYQPQVIKDKKQKQRIVGGHPTGDWVGNLPSKHTRVIVNFTDKSKLFFNDQRKFGWMKIATSDKLQEIMKKLPPDVIEAGFTVDYLTQVLAKSSRAVKLVILDQKKIGGMGNIYACDSLWLARLDPRRPAKSLQKEEVVRLHLAMQQVIGEGIKYGGASERNFVHVNGLGGHYQDHFLVYGKEGEECIKCGTSISKVKVGGGGTTYCGCCQK